MPRSRLVAAALFLVAAGCASNEGARPLEREGNATLTGIVTPPSGGGQTGSPSCTGVMVRVFHTSEPTRPLGRVMVRQSRERCLDVVSSLPSNAELRLEVIPGMSWRCQGEAAPTLAPRPGTVRLRDYETATRDFRATCG
jgi:hypothetical protein